MDHEEVKEADMALPVIKKPTVRKKKNHLQDVSNIY